MSGDVKLPDGCIVRESRIIPPQKQIKKPIAADIIRYLAHSKFSRNDLEKLDKLSDLEIGNRWSGLLRVPGIAVGRTIGKLKEQFGVTTITQLRAKAKILLQGGKVERNIRKETTRKKLSGAEKAIRSKSKRMGTEKTMPMQEEVRAANARAAGAEEAAVKAAKVAEEALEAVRALRGVKRGR